MRSNYLFSFWLVLISLICFFSPSTMPYPQVHALRTCFTFNLHDLMNLNICCVNDMASIVSISAQNFTTKKIARIIFLRHVAIQCLRHETNTHADVQIHTSRLKFAHHYNYQGQQGACTNYPSIVPIRHNSCNARHWHESKHPFTSIKFSMKFTNNPIDGIHNNYRDQKLQP